MALIVQPVLGDLGSNEFTQLRKSYNNLLAAIVAASDFPTLQANLQLAATKTPQIVETIELPTPPQFPVKHS